MLNGDPVKYTSQEMNNSSFDETSGLNAVEIVGEDGLVKNPATEAKQDSIIGLQANRVSIVGDYLYEGNAVPGSATSSAVWQVSRFDKVNLVTVWADGDTNFNNVWDDHLTLNYI
jgi:hypothetical protein